MPMRAQSIAARLLREAKSDRGLTGQEMATQAQYRDPQWRVPIRTTVGSLACWLADEGFLRITHVGRGGNDPHIYRRTPKGDAEIARLYPAQGRAA